MYINQIHLVWPDSIQFKIVRIYHNDMKNIQNYSKSAFQAWISFWLWMCSDDDDNEGRYAVLVPAGWGWWLTSDWGLGGVGVWLSPFSAGVILWSFDSEGASLNVSTCASYETFRIKQMQSKTTAEQLKSQISFKSGMFPFCRIILPNFFIWSTL